MDRTCKSIKLTSIKLTFNSKILIILIIINQSSEEVANQSKEVNATTHCAIIIIRHRCFWSRRLCKEHWNSNSVTQGKNAPNIGIGRRKKHQGSQDDDNEGSTERSKIGRIGKRRAPLNTDNRDISSHRTLLRSQGTTTMWSSHSVQERQDSSNQRRDGDFSLLYLKKSQERGPPYLLHMICTVSCVASGNDSN